MSDFSLTQRTDAFVFAAGTPLIALGIYAIGNDIKKDKVAFTEFYPSFVKNNCYYLLYAAYKGKFPKNRDFEKQDLMNEEEEQ